MNPVNPKVSIVMAVYNGESFLKESIQSVLSQTFQDFEFIIIDDGSTDNSANILKSFSDPRIKVISNEKNLGLIASLNKGITSARGEYIARQDDDDISLPTRIEREVEILSQFLYVGLVGTYFSIINERGVCVQNKTVPITATDIKNTLKAKNCFAHGSVMLRKKCFDKTTFYRKEFKHCEDFDLWLRISEHYECRNIPEYLYLWRLRSSSITVKNRLYQNLLSTLAIEFQKKRIRFGQDPIEQNIWSQRDIDNTISKDRVNYCRSIIESLHFQGISFLLNEKTFKAFSCFTKALKYNLVEIKTWFWIVMSGIKTFLPLKPFCSILNVIFQNK